jgi:uncharacterized protein YlxP (DUF503 family)
MKQKILVLTSIFAGLILTTLVYPQFILADKKLNQKQPQIQIAILLDTSGSMSGLIDQAKSHLWDIVNHLATSRQNGQKPFLQVALFEYGKSTLPAQDGYIRKIVPLSNDLDQLSEQLFSLNTNGGEEYCGWAIKSALEQLQWSNSSQDYKAIFIAGNEPFNQGNIDYKEICRQTIAQGIIVNTIFCGNLAEGERTFWKHGADLTDGNYLNIDHHQKKIVISAPQDDRIIELGKELNKTYIGYGQQAEAGAARQEKQDSNALSVNKEVMVKRAASKATPMYSNAAWDLVDAEAEGKVKLEEVNSKMLPENMQKMSHQEQLDYLKQMKTKRNALQKEIQQLKTKRDVYIAEQRKEDSAKNTLGNAMIATISNQLAKKKFVFQTK